MAQIGPTHYEENYGPFEWESPAWPLRGKFVSTEGFKHPFESAVVYRNKNYDIVLEARGRVGPKFHLAGRGGTEGAMIEAIPKAAIALETGGTLELTSILPASSEQLDSKLSIELQGHEVLHHYVAFSGKVTLGRNKLGRGRRRAVVSKRTAANVVSVRHGALRRSCSQEQTRLHGRTYTNTHHLADMVTRHAASHRPQRLYQEPCRSRVRTTQS